VYKTVLGRTIDQSRGCATPLTQNGATSRICPARHRIGERIIVLFHLDGNGGPAQRLLKIAHAEFSPGGVNEYPALIGPSGPLHLRSLPLLSFESSFLAPSFRGDCDFLVSPVKGRVNLPVRHSVKLCRRHNNSGPKRDARPTGTLEREPQVPR
jgi:hypothetical protein